MTSSPHPLTKRTRNQAPKSFTALFIILSSIFSLCISPAVSLTPTSATQMSTTRLIPPGIIAPTLTPLTTAKSTRTTTTPTATTPTSTAIFLFPTHEPKISPNFTFEACPPPLIPNIQNLSSASCMGACCLPCPASSVFYEPHKLETVYTVTSIFRAVSAIACAILAVTYFILPSRRRHPHLIVLLFAALMVPWEGLGTAWLYKREDLLCKSVYEIAEMTNSWLCAVQGVALLYLVLVLLCLGFLLITNLHVLIVYRSSLVQAYLSKLMVLAFILPLALVVPVVIKKQIMNPGFGSICFVGPDVADAYFFIPMSVLVCLAMLLHLGTIFFMIKTKLKANTLSSVSASHSQGQGISNPITTSSQRRLQTARDISLLLKQQWRPGLLALCLLIVDMIYWLFYFMEAKKLKSAGPAMAWFQDWVTCLGQQATLAVKSGALSPTYPTLQQIESAGEIAQMVCASVARPWVPNLAWAATTELLPALFGLIILTIFGSRMDLWQDLRVRLFGTRRRRAARSGSGATYMLGDIMKENRDNAREQPPPRPKHDLRSFTHDDMLYKQSQHQSQHHQYQIDQLYSYHLGSITLTPSAAATTVPMRAYRLDTPEPWKPTSWPASLTIDDPAANLFANASAYNSSNISSSLTPQLEIDAKPIPLTTSTATSPHKTFYNDEDFEPSSVLSPAARNNNNKYADQDQQTAVVTEASRVRLNYKTSTDVAHQFETQSLSHVYRQQQSQPPEYQQARPHIISRNVDR